MFNGTDVRLTCHSIDGASLKVMFNGTDVSLTCHSIDGGSLKVMFKMVQM